MCVCVIVLRKRSQNVSCESIISFDFAFQIAFLVQLHKMAHLSSAAKSQDSPLFTRSLDSPLFKMTSCSTCFSYCFIILVRIKWNNPF